MKCPHCEKPDFVEHCGFCGCTKKINPVSGNTIYMIRGRVVAAPDDLREQQEKHDRRYGIGRGDPVDSSGAPVDEENSS